MSRSAYRQTAPRAHRAINAQHKAAHHHDMRAEGHIACQEREEITPIPIPPPHLVSFNFNPRDFDTTNVVDAYEDDYLLESVNMNSTFNVADSFAVAIKPHLRVVYA